MPSHTDRAGLTVALEDRYRVEHQLGEGGMATVFLAHDLKHDRPVALKVLRPELAAVVGAERFLAEIRTTANLQHPHILPLFDSGEAGGRLFYVMPFVPGGESLRERLERQGQLRVEDAVAVATSVAHALDYAHRAGVVHRDVKPANILLQDGQPVVADFGIALAVSESGGGRLTETGLSLGTPQYMSPEQATGEGRIGPATDVYALGCVLFEMLVGEPPYTGSTAQAVLGKILTGTPTPPRELRPAVPANVDAAVRKALERLPADRFSTASDFAQALADRGFRHGEAAGAAPAGVGGPWKAAAIGAGALALALGAALALAVTSDMSFRGPDPFSRVSTWEVALPDGLALYSGSGVNLDVSPDGSTLAFVGITADREIQLWLRRLDQLTPVPLRGTAGGQNPRFSPDGESVAFTTGDALRVTTLTGAPLRTLVGDSVQNIGGLAWGPDGTIYFRKLGQGIWRVPAGGGSAEEVTAPGERAHQWPDVLPDGSAILLTVDHGGVGRDSIAVLSLETGERRTLLWGAMARYAYSGHVVYASAEGRLMAAPFDPDRLEVTGPSRAVLEGVEVSDSSASNFALSRTGVLAYRPGRGVVLGTSGGGGIPVWVSRDGSVEPLDPGLTGLSQAPAISPDGRRVALEHRPDGGARDIWMYDLDQGTLTRTTFGPEGDGRRRPFWRPDGQEIGFRDRPEGGSLSLYAIASDGSETTPRLLRTPAGSSIQEGIWTPDGRGLVYREGALSVVDARFTGDVTILYASAHPDSAARVLVETPFEWYAPSISPDGRWLAYTSHESGRAEVYVRPFPGPGGRELVSDGGGGLPEWTRDGREIIYQALDGPLVVAAVRTEPDFAVLSRERHPEWPQPFTGNPTQHFDTSPDGRILVIDASGIGTRVRDVVVQNFFEDLRRRAPE